MKIVLDTNVLVSALLFHGKTGKIIGLIENGEITPCFTLETLEELRQVLERDQFKKNLTEIQVRPAEIIASLLQQSILCPAAANQSIPPVPDDPTDTIFLVCAISCNAACIVSGDKHLLKLKKFNSIPIFSPTQFLQQIQRS